MRDDEQDLATVELGEGSPEGRANGKSQNEEGDSERVHLRAHIELGRDGLGRPRICRRRECDGKNRHGVDRSDERLLLHGEVHGISRVVWQKLDDKRLRNCATAVIWLVGSGEDDFIMYIVALMLAGRLRTNRHVYKMLAIYGGADETP